ncbi:class C sortase [Arcanobacterium hippocoleae]|uniref:Sortase A n=1 Tax=Arcanobacterium hippocoleae TaxID=149017 RepID=A0ABU1T2M8_9ACTO|nr:class C sortase [Arcanobacterium hippocoleae]MDR6939640.1 sortase A [Arcanobacterium hippocoleae]
MPKHRQKTKKRINKSAIVVAVLFLLGTTVVLYPQAAQWFSQLRQSRIVSAYEDLAQRAVPDEATQIQQAHKYNELLAGEQLVDIAGHVPTTREKHLTTQNQGLLPYDQQLLVDESGLMGRVLVPSADIDLPIYHGSSDTTLLKGAGHLQGTALPVGGAGTRAVITAHRGLAESAMFTHLDQAKIGDQIIFQIFGKTLVYQISDIQIVEPDATESIRAQAGADLATLITCTPLGINSHRIIVTGERVTPEPDDAVAQAEAVSALPHFPWWIVIWCLALLLCLWFIWFARTPVKRKTQETQETNQGAVSSQ